MEIERLTLIERLTTVSPALSDRAIVPILANFCFTGKELYAFNGQVAIEVPCETSFKGGAPGGTLLSLLKASRARNVTLEPDKEILLVKAASARIKLPLIPPEDFEYPDLDVEPETFPVATAEFVDGIKSCLQSVSLDTSVPDQLGVTLIGEGDFLSLFSTNNYTLSHVELKLKKAFKGRAILPAVFCEQLVRLADKTEPLKLQIIDNDYAVFVNRKGVRLFGRLISVERPYRFRETLDRQLDALPKKFAPVPKLMRAVIDRSTIIVVGSIDGQSTAIDVHDGRMHFKSVSERGEVIDNVAFPDHPEVKLNVSPKLMKSGVEDFDEIALSTKAAVFRRKGTLYLVAAAGGK